LDHLVYVLFETRINSAHTTVRLQLHPRLHASFKHYQLPRLSPSLDM